jgi:NSS family neurotransmitter:Na+ symporter
LLAFALAYPALMAELIIGRYARANGVTALRTIATGPKSKLFGSVVGGLGIVTVSFILSFYAIVSGWMLAFLLQPIADAAGLDALSEWLAVDGILRNSIFVIGFMLLTVFIISAGVKEGIEKWATRLMPSLVLILVFLIGYVFTLPGAMDGLRAYLVPDFSVFAKPGLLVSAMGQAFFSLSLGVGTMLVYGSYISKNENLPVIGSLVALLDVGIAVLAGLLILPAMYVALASGVEIFDAQGGLIAGPGLIISVLPALFDSMGAIGGFVAFAFFALMTIASLTSSISMLEVPVSFVVESREVRRPRAAMLLGSIIAVISLVIVFNFDALFEWVVTVTTEMSQPLLGLFFCIFTGWIWNRSAILEEIKQGSPNAASGFFWKVWPFYIRFICPAAIVVVYFQ